MLTALTVKHSSHFLQAHALLNLHIIHSSQQPPSSPTAGVSDKRSPPSADCQHPGLGPASFRIYSSTSRPLGEDNEAFSEPLEFSAMQLLRVMGRLTEPNSELSYFALCREMGVRAVDGMVRGKILDLRWTDPVSKDILTRGGRGSSNVTPRLRPISLAQAHGHGHGPGPVGSHATMVNPEAPDVVEDGFDYGLEDDEDEMEPIPEAEFHARHPLRQSTFIGPVLVPATPVMRYAIQEVVEEYEDTQSTSEYASLTDVDEY